MVILKLEAQIFGLFWRNVIGKVIGKIEKSLKLKSIQIQLLYLGVELVERSVWQFARIQLQKCEPWFRLIRKLEALDYLQLLSKIQDWIWLGLILSSL